MAELKRDGVRCGGVSGDRIEAVSGTSRHRPEQEITN